jgi:pyruvate formate-lyase activating enzyme-like uncharacterized protein
MQTSPEILRELLENIPAHHSNTHELRAEWKKYIRALETEFPEVVIADDGDTVCVGELSPGCICCKNGEWDCSFITHTCNLNCEFCISPSLPDSRIPVSAYGKTLGETVNNYKKANITGISFSGGEPFLYFPEIITRLEALKQELPDNYYWVYTNGTLAHKEQIDLLADVGINEIRYDTAATGYNNDKILNIIEYSAKKIAHVTVEIPVVLRDKDVLVSAIPDYVSAGVTYLNLHELMKEHNTPSQHLENENFIQCIFEDGHTTEISLDSRLVVKDIVRRMIDSKTAINLNFCSIMNKLRQLRKRRNNLIQVIKQPHEKVVDEEYLETIFIFRDKETYQFIHPDDWQTKQEELKNYTGIALKKIAPLSIFHDAGYISAQTL